MNKDVVKSNTCVEINFSLHEDPIYDDCWLGVMPDRKTHEAVFWFGLTPDGKQAYDYSTFDEMWKAPVLRGKSLSDCWGDIEIESINGCTPELMMSFP